MGDTKENDQIDTRLNAYLAAPDLESFYDMVVYRIEKTYTAVSGNGQSFAGEVLALEFYQKSLAIREKVLGKDHPNTVQVFQRIADLRKLTGEK
ncbi:tetratricopeptide repeat protein [Treponema primitia]|uniref:tetratricopeptide repeat protein n=1 Tax=Treponema primitia TaxID=88058 RepID=UPI00397EF9CE